MNEISRTISKGMFYLVALVLLSWTASLTVAFVASALPQMAWFVPYFALVVFDGGMITWLFVFLKYASGVIQRASALTLCLFDFVGLGLMVIAEILLGGQTLTEAPAALGTWAIWGIGIWTVANVFGVLLFHWGNPEAQKQMAIQNEKDAVWQGALKNLAGRRADSSHRLASELGGRMYREMLAELLVDRDGDGVPDLLQGGTYTAPNSGPPPLPADAPDGAQWSWLQVSGNGYRWTLVYPPRPAEEVYANPAYQNGRSDSGHRPGENFT